MGNREIPLSYKLAKFYWSHHKDTIHRSSGISSISILLTALTECLTALIECLTALLKVY